LWASKRAEYQEVDVEKQKVETPTLPDEIGSQLGNAAVAQILDKAGRFCSCERQRIEEANQPLIVKRRAEIALLADEEQQLQERIRQAPPVGDLRSRRQRAYFEFAFAIVLIGAAVCFSWIGLEPFQLGYKAVLYCVALALIAPYSIEMVLKSWDQHRQLIRGIALTAAGLSIFAIGFLSLIRAHVFAQQLTSVAPVVMEDIGSAASSTARPSFFDQTQMLLTIFMLFAALAIEVVAGFALHQGLRLWEDGGEDAAALRCTLEQVRYRMAELLGEIGVLEKEASVFVNRFWRDFHRTMLEGSERSALTKIWIFLLCGLLLLQPKSAFAREPLNVVVAVDLTQSVAGASGFDHKTELDKNLAGVAQILAEAPSGSRVTVVGITDRSFSEPYVLLSAQVTNEAGYFKEKIAAAHVQLAQEWQRRCKGLVAHFRQTDLLGSLVLTSQLFQGSGGGRNVLVIFSDMRHETKGLNLSRSQMVPVAALLQQTEKQGLVADLRNVDVYVLGVDGAGKQVSYWNSLRQFWLAYFEKAHASMRAYSMLREVPAFEP
jgi:hypothetical protein